MNIVQVVLVMGMNENVSYFCKNLIPASRPTGHGQFSMEFSHYNPCPKNVADEVIKAAQERQAAAKA